MAVFFEDIFPVAVNRALLLVQFAFVEGQVYFWEKLVVSIVKIYLPFRTFAHFGVPFRHCWIDDWRLVLKLSLSVSG